MCRPVSVSANDETTRKRKSKRGSEARLVDRRLPRLDWESGRYVLQSTRALPARLIEPLSCKTFAIVVRARPWCYVGR